MSEPLKFPPSQPDPIRPPATKSATFEVPVWAEDGIRRLCHCLCGVDASAGGESPLGITADGREQARNEVRMGLVTWGVPQTKIVDGARKTGMVMGAIPMADVAISERPEILWDFMPLCGATAGNAVAAGGLLALDHAPVDQVAGLLNALTHAQARGAAYCEHVIKERLSRRNKGLVVAQELPGPLRRRRDGGGVGG